MSELKLSLDTQNPHVLTEASKFLYNLSNIVQGHKGTLGDHPSNEKLKLENEKLLLKIQELEKRIELYTIPKGEPFKLNDAEQPATTNCATPCESSVDDPCAVPQIGPYVELDSTGLPWDERINTSNRSKTKGGAYKRRPGVTDAFVESVKAQLRAGLAALTETPVAPAVAPETPVTPAVAPETPVTPAVTPEVPATPAVTPEVPATPAVTPEVPATPVEYNFPMLMNDIKKAGFGMNSQEQINVVNSLVETWSNGEFSNIASFCMNTDKIRAFGEYIRTVNTKA